MFRGFLILFTLLTLVLGWVAPSASFGGDTVDPLSKSHSSSSDLACDDDCRAENELPSEDDFDELAQDFDWLHHPSQIRFELVELGAVSTGSPNYSHLHFYTLERPPRA